MRSKGLIKKFWKNREDTFHPLWQLVFFTLGGKGQDYKCLWHAKICAIKIFLDSKMGITMYNISEPTNVQGNKVTNLRVPETFIILLFGHSAIRGHCCTPTLWFGIVQKCVQIWTHGGNRWCRAIMKMVMRILQMSTI